MADDKQVTVAELLARNKAERESRGGEPRRRRRRSLEEGGISVAELTGNLEKVKAKPAQSKHSSVPIDETAPVIPAPKKPASEEDAAAKEQAKEQPISETKLAPKVAAKKDEAAEKPKSAVKTPAEDETTIIKRVDTPAETKPQAKADELSETGEIPVVRDGASAVKKSEAAESEAEQTEAAEPELAGDTDEGRDGLVDEYQDEYADEEDSKLNPVAIIMLALVGIVLGAVVFKGFEILWGRMSFSIVAVLAVVVTGVMIGIVHALRTNTDKLSMALAGVVGLVLTFGPLLLV